MLKRFTLFLLVIFIFTQASACSSDSSDSSTSEWNNGDRLKPAALTIMLPYPNQFPINYDYELKQQSMKALEKKAAALNVSLKIGNTKSGLYFTSVTMDYAKAIDSNMPCDIFAATAPHGDMSTLHETLDSKGYAMDLTKLFPQYAPEYYKLFSPEELRSVTYNGKLLGIPSRTFPETKRLSIVIREDLAQNYGFNSIKGIDELEDFLIAVRRNEPGYTPLLFNTSTMDLFAGLYGYTILSLQPYGLGTGLVYKSDDPAMKVVSWEQTPEYIKAVDKLASWKSMGYVKEFWSPTDSEVLPGRYAAFIVENGSASKFNEMLAQDGGRKWRYAEYDLYPGHKSQRIFNPGGIFYISANQKILKEP